METTLEKAEVIAKDTMAKLTPKDDKAKAETKGAAAEEGKEKTEGIKVADVEKQAQEDERILTAEEGELSDPDKKRKTELLEIKKKKDESPEEKIKRVQESSQKRIDEIKSQLLEKENKSNEEIKRLKAELDELKKAMQPKIAEDAQAQIKRLEQEQINKFIEEDKNKPHQDRREMTKEELEVFLLEDLEAATEWITNRTLRRAEERKKLAEKPKESAKEIADDFVAKQTESVNKLKAKFPNAIPKGDLGKLLGKTDEEIDELLADDHEHARMAIKIVNSNPKKYLEQVDGPELVMAELEKALSKKPAKKTYTEDELLAKIEEARKQEAERLSRLEEGISSTKGKKVESTPKNKTELRQKAEAIARKAGMSTEEYDKMLERRSKIPGASTFDVQGEE